MKRALILLALAAFLPSQIGAAGLEVNAAASITGGFGLEVAFDGTTETGNPIVQNTQAAFVQDNSPGTMGPLTEYRAEFSISIPADFDFEFALPQGTSNLRQRAHHMIFLLFDPAQAAGAPRQHASLHIKKFDDGVNPPRLRLWARVYDPSSPQAAGDGYIYRDTGNGPLELNLPTGPAGYPVRVIFEWRQESSPGARDGMLRFSRANNFAPETFVSKENTAVSNNDKIVDRIMLGAVAGVDDGTLGSYFLDDFSSFRTLAP